MFKGATSLERTALCTFIKEMQYWIKIVGEYQDDEKDNQD